MTVTINVPPYQDYEKIIYSAIHQVWRSLGGDLDEMISCSGVLFMKAVQCYRPDRGMSLSTWIRKVTWDDTYAARRVELSQQKRYAKGDVDLLSVTSRHSEFSLQELMENLSEDARNLVSLALEPSGDIKMTTDGIPKKKSFCSVARRVFCWTDEQLQETIEEIRTCLLAK